MRWSSWNAQQDRPISIGYFGSNNGSNVDAVVGFVELAWPKIRERSKQPIELLICGTIADAQAVQRSAEVAGVRLQRGVRSPASFYQAVDLIVNPVRFGTGLKIKTIEALAHGRPVITTTHGAQGIGAIWNDSCITVETLESMVEPILAWSSDRAALAARGKRAHELARVEFSEEKVLGEFRRLLLEECERPHVKSPHSGQKMLE
jgi:glycosyltransferase involved in cell wall biosynthesis